MLSAVFEGFASFSSLLGWLHQFVMSYIPLLMSFSYQLISHRFRQTPISLNTSNTFRIVTIDRLFRLDLLLPGGPGVDFGQLRCELLLMLLQLPQFCSITR